jgi:hypothetical protein
MAGLVEEPRSGLIGALHECERMLVAVCDRHGVDVVALLTLGDEIAAICARSPVDSPGGYYAGDHDAVMALRLPFAGAHPGVPPDAIHWLIEAARCSREIRALMSAGDLGGAIRRLPLLARTSAFARLERTPTPEEVQSQFGLAGANAKHGKPGGSREKRATIRDIWASGKYSTRAICAEQECDGLGMSFVTAQKALRNTPDPDPWPGKLARRKR